MTVQKVLCVIPSLEYGSTAAQCVQLLLALNAGQFQRRVCVLGRAGSWAGRLRSAGVEVDAPGRGRLIDLKPLAALRDLVREYAPNVVHAWGLSTLRAVALSGFKGLLVASPCPQHDFTQSWLWRADGWLLRKAQRVIAFGETEASRCRTLGAAADRLAVVAPAVKPEQPSSALEPKRFILCIGRLEQHKGFTDAIWAFDMLRCVHPDLHLVIAGEGLERDRLRRFSVGLQSAPFVHLIGEVPEVFSLLREALVVWSPGRCETGTQVVLEAMAAGKPAVASRWPRLAELIVDGQTGFLLPPEDKAAWARQTQALLADASLRERIGAAARRRAEEHFTATALAEACARVYKE